MNDEEFDKLLHAAFWVAGETFPLTSEEVATMEEILETEDRDFNGDDISIDSLVECALAPAPNILKLENVCSFPEGLTRAARNGGQISPDIVEKMKRDKLANSSTKPETPSCETDDEHSEK